MSVTVNRIRHFCLASHLGLAYPSCMGYGARTTCFALTPALEEYEMSDYRIKPGCPVTLKEFDPDDTGRYKKNDEGKTKAKSKAEGLIAKLDQLQERLYANGSKALLIILQGMDTSG